MTTVEPDQVSVTDPRGVWGPLAEPLHTDRQIKPDDPPYRENVFLCFFDRDQRFYATSHMQGGKTKAGMWARCSILVDGRPTEIFEPLGDMTFASSRISFDLAGRLHVDADELQLDLTMTPIRPAVDFSPSRAFPGMKADDPLQHYEGAGRFHGTVTTPADGALQVAGTVIRDRSWGFRQEIASWAEYYAMFFSFADFDLASMKYIAHGGDVPPHGQLVGKRSGTVIASAVRRRDPWGSVSELCFGLEDGSTLGLSLGRPEAQILCPFNDPQGPQAFTAIDDLVEVHTSDGAVGFGIIEQGILRTQI
jgi:hypothetical protein